jgi:hypothetical protein
MKTIEQYAIQWSKSKLPLHTLHRAEVTRIKNRGQDWRALYIAYYEIEDRVAALRGAPVDAHLMQAVMARVATCPPAEKRKVTIDIRAAYAVMRAHTATWAHTPTIENANAMWAARNHWALLVWKKQHPGQSPEAEPAWSVKYDHL